MQVGRLCIAAVRGTTYMQIMNGYDKLYRGKLDLLGVASVHVARVNNLHCIENDGWYMYILYWSQRYTNCTRTKRT